jgi:hypothetical protein
MPATVTGTATRDNLEGSYYPTVDGHVTIAPSQTLVRGSVIGKITASGQGKLLAKGSADGSQNFYAVMLEAVTTGVGVTQVAACRLAGTFQTQALSFGAATTVADVIDDARDKNCYFQDGDADNNVVGD